ncbi:hexose transporter protein [Fusarium bulbicola]|nr:hexose transporter protein [Fusarium bulbicola]
MEATNRFMIGVFGPTGAGKTKLGVSIAKSVHGEVISVDSLQCYSPGSIITAKPNPEETNGVNHLEADEEPTNFVAEAIKRLEKLHGYGVIPVVVGGSTSLTLPLLNDALNRGWRMAAITLLPHQSTYHSNISARLDEMVEAGLLEEISGLKLLKDKHLNGKPNFRKGVWKAIGYQELYPYLEARRIDGHCDQLLKTGLASMKEKTFQYGISQLEWIRQALSPFLHAQKIENMSLTVVDKASWISDVEKPAIRMASDFCHASTSSTIHSINGPKPRVLCIFGGASSGNEPAHIEAAKSLGRVCHENSIKLVYGGGTTGVMGAIASTLVELSGPDAVHGIIPEALLKHEAKESGKHPKDPAYARYGKQTVVKDMHTRKRLMIQEAASQNFGMLVAARIILGSAPLLIAEIAHPQDRAILVTLSGASYHSGAFISSWVTYGTLQIKSNWSWRLPSLLQSICSVVILIGIFWMPESPRWLLSKDKHDEALKVLTHYHAEDDPDDEFVQLEFSEIKAAIALDKEVGQTAWVDFLKTPGNRKRIGLITALAFFSQWSGNGLISYYLKGIMDAVGITKAETQLGINAGMKTQGLIINTAFAFFIDIFGRRPIYLTSTIGTCVIFTFWTIVSARYAIDPNKALGYAFVALTFIYGLFYDIKRVPPSYVPHPQI